MPNDADAAESPEGAAVFPMIPPELGVHPLTLAVGGHGAFVLACDAALGPFMAEA